MREQRPCVFCGKFGSKSKEHFYPSWMGAFIDGTGVSNTASRIDSFGLEPSELVESLKRQGHLFTKSLRVVCKGCNSGWMSLLEKCVKPLLMAGLFRQDVELDAEAKRDLASWVCVKSIVCEHDKPGLAATPSIDRRRLFESLRIPDYFRIYMSRQSTPAVAGIFRHSVALAFGESRVRSDHDATKHGFASSEDVALISPPLLDGMKRNTQSISFILGGFFFHVLSARVQDFPFDSGLAYPGLERLWPSSDAPINTATMRILSAQQMGSVIHSLENFMMLQSPTFLRADL